MEKKYLVIFLWITVQHKRSYMFVHSSPMNTSTHILPLWAPLQTVDLCLHVCIRYESSSTQSSLGCVIHMVCYECRIHMSGSDTKFPKLTCLHLRPNTEIEHKKDDPGATHGHVSSTTQISVARITLCNQRIRASLKTSSQKHYGKKEHVHDSSLYMR
jgi:hypothetical protein